MTWGLRRVKQMTCHIFISFFHQLKYLLFLRKHHVWRPFFICIELKSLLQVSSVAQSELIGPYVYTYKCKYEYFSGKQMFGWKSWFKFPQELHISEF